ncbi:MAG TPA: hypothetical protein DEG17_07085 [Cyanobacteria bacterium UBA11149]|nr:hypothetical protein [Cyanobacteria bacterium UBA11366]HBK62852.1 hypothetical protein [Cyanobacteria bacterium UBA11166]HBR73568.1 hypothetical protein [Cyanobacteria bacterium UBA11159]HBS70956.1 hypothetical protein [Cyanobacteria bacterium UBA11153]HBW88630.1 hypothetical protein [Cyanobacteria bacterium UBA11149]HCA93195.1 hypothetical protein [Cyanobacteria bacterium UBA9226]
MKAITATLITERIVPTQALDPEQGIGISPPQRSCNHQLQPVIQLTRAANSLNYSHSTQGITD